MSTNDGKQLWYITILIGIVLLVLSVKTQAYTAEDYATLNDAVLYQRNIQYSEVQHEGLIRKIIHCESGGRVTAQNPHSTAYGLCQFLDSTWAYVERKWEMDLDRYDYDDQLYACDRLLREEGVRHWKASESCWKS